MSVKVCNICIEIPFCIEISLATYACVALPRVDHLTDWKWKLLIHPDLISNIQGRSISTLCLTPGTLRLAKVWWKAFNPLNKTIHFKTQISLQIRFLQASVECSIKLETSKFVPQSKPSLWKSNFWSRYSSYCSFFSIVQLCIWRQIHSEHLYVMIS